ncbi:MAG: GIY-YIG nuclease family protein [Candidatus Latescibacterota bacterium]|nr:GIY-YIG nuclease family protein [Candidatus Latescibacterota bacterium]
MWYIYIIRCDDKTLYTGITTNVERRFNEHERGGPRGAKYLRGRGPLQLVAQVEVGDRRRATRLEHYVKALPRNEKERLIGCPSALQTMAKTIEG